MLALVLWRTLNKWKIYLAKGKEKPYWKSDEEYNETALFRWWAILHVLCGKYNRFT